MRRNFSISTFICPECNTKFPIPRKKSNQREKGHIKDIWCPFCKDTRKMLEYKENEFIDNL